MDSSGKGKRLTLRPLSSSPGIEYESSIRTGILFKHSAGSIRSRKRRLFVLKGGMLIYFKVGYDKPVGMINLEDALNVSEAKNMCMMPFSFVVVTKQKTYILTANTHANMTDWIKDLNTVIHRNIEVQKNRSSNTIASVAPALMNRFESASSLDSNRLSRDTSLESIDCIDKPNHGELNANRVATLFRSNGMSSKLLKAYGMLIANTYLTDTLKPALQELYKMKSSMEVDPLKIDKTDESMPISERVEINQQRVLSSCKLLLDTILDSINSAPVELRQLCKLLKTQVTANFNEAVGTKVVGGFLFLRFFCPAIVMPEQFGLLNSVTQEVDRNLRRGLLLVTKVLQNLANGVAFGLKEEFMCPFNTFISENSTSITEYFCSFATLPNEGNITPSFDPSNCDVVGASRWLREMLEKLIIESSERPGEHTGILKELRSVLQNVGNVGREETDRQVSQLLMRDDMRLVSALCVVAPIDKLDMLAFRLVDLFCGTDLTWRLLTWAIEEEVMHGIGHSKRTTLDVVLTADVVKEGYISKLSQKSLASSVHISQKKRRWCVLRDDGTFCLFKAQNDRIPSTQIDVTDFCSILYDDDDIVDHDANIPVMTSKGLGFKLVTREHRYHFYVSNEVELSSWLNALMKVRKSAMVRNTFSNECPPLSSSISVPASLSTNSALEVATTSAVPVSESSKDVSLVNNLDISSTPISVVSPVETSLQDSNLSNSAMSSSRGSINQSDSETDHGLVIDADDDSENDDFDVSAVLKNLEMLYPNMTKPLLDESTPSLPTLASTSSTNQPLTVESDDDLTDLLKEMNSIVNSEIAYSSISEEYLSDSNVDELSSNDIIPSTTPASISEYDVPIAPVDILISEDSLDTTAPRNDDTYVLSDLESLSSFSTTSNSGNVTPIDASQAPTLIPSGRMSFVSETSGILLTPSTLCRMSAGSFTSETSATLSYQLDERSASSVPCAESSHNVSNSTESVLASLNVYKDSSTNDGATSEQPAATLVDSRGTLATNVDAGTEVVSSLPNRTDGVDPLTKVMNTLAGLSASASDVDQSTAGNTDPLSEVMSAMSVQSAIAPSVSDVDPVTEIRNPITEQSVTAPNVDSSTLPNTEDPLTEVMNSIAEQSATALNVDSSTVPNTEDTLTEVMNHIAEQSVTAPNVDSSTLPNTEDPLTEVMNSIAELSATAPNVDSSTLPNTEDHLSEVMNSIEETGILNESFLHLDDNTGQNETTLETVENDILICHTCQEHIHPETEAHVKAFGRCYHEDHFVCTNCATILHAMYRLRVDAPYCMPCYTANFSKCCLICNEVINGVMVSANDGVYHEHCFVCATCGVQLKKFVTFSGQIYCENPICISSNSEAIMCSGCQLAIVGGYLQAADGMWHEECFNCCVCEAPVMDSLGGRDGSSVYCVIHWNEKEGNVCRICNEVIITEVLTAGKNKYHSTCFCCDTCGINVSEAAFALLNTGRPRCSSCINL